MSATILIVEDNPQNLYLTTYLLTRRGYRVVSARDGVAAIAAAQAEAPDLILMDIQLPQMDGYEAVQRIKALVQFGHVPVIAITSYAMTGDREKALAAGCAGYIEKPIAPDTFVSEIERFLPPELVAEDLQ